MTPDIYLDGRVTQYCGDVQSVLQQFPADYYDCCVTSPPYWGLRDYGVDGQLGLERTLGEHIETMVSVLSELRRVLKPSGCLWLNYGDCYATSPNGRSAADTKAAGNDDRTFRDKPFSTIGPIYPAIAGDPFRRDMGRRGGGMNSDPCLKPKDLAMVPNRIAIALQEDGWWVRAECIWGKKNPMPDSSGRWRPGTAHEKIWLLTKSADSYYDSEAVAINRTGHTPVPSKQDKPDKQRGHSRRHAGFNARWDQMTKAEQQANGRLLRNYEPAPLIVWEMATEPFSEAHFATFPPELVERCIKAGCPEGGEVIDPFGGSGTTAMIAAALGRRATLIELNPEYCTLARARIEASLMGPDAAKHHMARKLGRVADAGPLFAPVVENS